MEVVIWTQRTPHIYHHFDDCSSVETTSWWNKRCFQAKGDVSPSLWSGSDGLSLLKVGLDPCIKMGTYYETIHSPFTLLGESSITTALMMSRQSVQNVLLQSSVKVRQTQPVPHQESQRRSLSDHGGGLSPQLVCCVFGWALLCSSQSVVVLISSGKQWLSVGVGC